MWQASWTLKITKYNKTAKHMSFKYGAYIHECPRNKINKLYIIQVPFSVKVSETLTILLQIALPVLEARCVTILEHTKTIKDDKQYRIIKDAFLSMRLVSIQGIRQTNLNVIQTTWTSILQRVKSLYPLWPQQTSCINSRYEFNKVTTKHEHGYLNATGVFSSFTITRDGCIQRGVIISQWLDGLGRTIHFQSRT